MSKSGGFSLPYTYVINMEKDTLKKENMKEQLSFQSNSSFEFINAVDGVRDESSIAYMNKYFSYMGITNKSQPITFERSIMSPAYKLKYNYSRQHITNGSLGLIQSAFLLLKKFVERNDTDHAVILEDDVYTLKKFQDTLSINKESLKGKDLVYIGCHTNDNVYSKKYNTKFLDISKHTAIFYGTYAMIFSKKLARHVLSIGIDNILRLNLSWDLLLNYIRNTGDNLTFFMYTTQLFIPNVTNPIGINAHKRPEFYIKNNIILTDYYMTEEIANNTKNSIFNEIDKVVYINLPHRTDRNHQIKNELSVFPPEKILRFNAIQHENGGIGCSMSHIGVLELAIKNKWRNVLIVEDDMKWVKIEEGDGILSRLIRRPYDVIMLSGHEVKYNKTSYKLKHACARTAYLVSNQYYEKLLSNFKEGLGHLEKEYIGIYRGDRYWNRLQETDNWYIVIPQMCVQSPSFSDIEKKPVNYVNYVNNNEAKNRKKMRFFSGIKHSLLSKIQKPTAPV